MLSVVGSFQNLCKRFRIMQAKLRDRTSSEHQQGFELRPLLAWRGRIVVRQEAIPKRRETGALVHQIDRILNDSVNRLSHRVSLLRVRVSADQRSRHRGASQDRRRQERGLGMVL